MPSLSTYLSKYLNIKMTLTQGQKFPLGIDFAYVPIELSTVKEESALACSRPLPLSLDKLIDQNKGGNILFVSVPGAFTPTCTENHIPPFLSHLAQLKEKKISTVVVLSANDPFVINAWGKLLLQDADLSLSELPKVIFASDPNAKFSSDNGISVDLTDKGLGVRTNRYAFVVNADSQEVTYFGLEGGPGVSVSGYEAVINAKL